MKGRIKMPLLDWAKLLIISGLTITSSILLMYGCNVAIVSCFGYVVK